MKSCGTILILTVLAATRTGSDDNLEIVPGLEHPVTVGVPRNESNGQPIERIG